MADFSDIAVERRTTPFGRKLIGVIRLLRPLNLFMFVVAVFLGGFLVAGMSVFAGPLLIRLIIASVAVASIGGAANSLNDAVDASIDRINRPDRPIPSGDASVRTAVFVWAIGSMVGIMAGFALSVWHLTVAVVVVAFMVLYSIRLKRTLFLGNMVVSLVVATSILFGAGAVGAIQEAAYAAGFAFLVTLVREIVKDVADMAGDAAHGARTLPIVMGRKRAVAVASTVTAIVVILTPVPFLLAEYSTLYLALVML
ncbi:MAG: geranylgeranylglycerol-phosphate geranylgeranyltransferase, partial [Bacteroidota bacterium]